MNSTQQNLRLINRIFFVSVKTIIDTRGNLSVIEGGKDLPFDIKRVFYIWNNQENSPRGGHAHKNLYQAFIAINGKCKIELNDNKETATYELSEPNRCILIPPLIWCDIYDFSWDCVLLAIVSDYYDESDYIRDYDEYIKYIQDRDENPLL